MSSLEKMANEIGTRQSRMQAMSKVALEHSAIIIEYEKERQEAEDDAQIKAVATIAVRRIRELFQEFRENNKPALIEWVQASQQSQALSTGYILAGHKDAVDMFIKCQEDTRVMASFLLDDDQDYIGSLEIAQAVLSRTINNLDSEGIFRPSDQDVEAIGGLFGLGDSQ